MKDQIKIKKINSKLLNDYKNEIIQLMIDSYKINFSQDVDLKKIETRFSNLLSYVNEEKGYIIAAFMDNRILGYLWYFITSNQRIHINQIIINSDERHNGLGTKLINHLYEEAKNIDIEEIELKVTKSNDIAFQFYKKEGFKIERMLLKRDIDV